MLQLGHSQSRAVAVLWCWAALIAFGAVSISLYSTVWVWLGLAAGLVIAVVTTFAVPRVRGGDEQGVVPDLD